MSAPIDQHTLAVFVRGLEAALSFEWRSAVAQDVRAGRQTAAALVLWGRELCQEAGCANCGSTRPARCPDCEWPLGKPVPDAAFCSICRRRHGPEVTHACE